MGHPLRAPAPDRTTAAAAPGRLSALDSSRALLMLLGLWVHAAAPYREPGGWLVDDPAGSDWLSHSSAWIAEFRMPAFYVLAGLLSAWALHRRGAGSFLTRRALRLLLPLAVVALTLNLLQWTLLDAHAARHCTVAGDCAVERPPAPWLGHLWFLLDLFVYTVLLVAFGPWLAKAAGACERRLAHQPRRWLTPLLLVAPVGAYFGWSLAVGLATLLVPALDRAWFGFWSFSWTAKLSFFFAAGAFLAGLPSFRRKVTEAIHPALPIVTGLAGSAAMVLRSMLDLPRNGVADKVLHAFVDAVPTALLTVFAISACLLLQHRLRPVASGLSRWSYSIYLSHHVAVVATALLLLDVALPPVAKFALVLASVGLLSTAAAALVERSRWLTLMFNGEWRDATRDSQPAPTTVPRQAPASTRVPSELEILEGSAGSDPLARRPARPATASDEPGHDRIAS